MPDEDHIKAESALHVMPGVTADVNRAMKPRARRRSLTVDEYVDGVRRSERAIIGRTFSLMESSNPSHRATAAEVLDRLMPYSGNAIRLGVSGVPGAGKSTFIEALGTHLTTSGKRVAVLAVDPSSDLSGGSILGDKTRMENLARDPNALVRPTACGTWLGGVARGTRESIIICEAAGYDVVMVETVGVGQSETQVASMVDFFLLLLIAGGGDELQGIKRGIIELADTIAINKADGDNIAKAELARVEYQGALRLLHASADGWTPKVVTCSALTGNGIDAIWKLVSEHQELFLASGQLQAKRQKQSLYWMKQSLEHLLIDRFYRREGIAAEIQRVRQEVLEGKLSPFTAAEELINFNETSDNSNGTSGGSR